MEAQCGCVGGQVYRKDQERDEQLQTEGTVGGRFQKYKEDKMERR